MNELLNSIDGLVCPKDITILSIWTDEKKCVLKKLLDKFGIQVINTYIPTNMEFKNPYKIKCIYNALKQVKTKYTLILDGYDSLIISFDDLIKKFKKTNLKILFNASKHNYPKVEVDAILKRESYGDYKYINAGCCIGYTDYLLKFYKKANKITDKLDNPYDSEQFIIRNVFAKDNKKVFFDYECDIFQTLGSSHFYYIGDNKCLIK